MIKALGTNPLPFKVDGGWTWLQYSTSALSLLILEVSIDLLPIKIQVKVLNPGKLLQFNFNYFLFISLIAIAS